MQVVNTYEEARVACTGYEWFYNSVGKIYLHSDRTKSIFRGISLGQTIPFGKNSYNCSKLLNISREPKKVLAYFKAEPISLNSEAIRLNLGVSRWLRAGVEKYSCYGDDPSKLKELYSDWLKLNPVLISSYYVTSQTLEVWKELMQEYQYVFLDEFKNWQLVNNTLEEVLKDENAGIRIAIVSNNLIGYDNYSIPMSSEELDIIPLSYTEFGQRYYPLPNAEIERVTNISKLLDSWSGAELLSD